MSTFMRFVGVKIVSVYFEGFFNPKTPNTTIAKFANTVYPDETANNRPYYLNLQGLPSSTL